MGHLERGEKNVSFGSMARVANSLGLSLSEMLAGLESGDNASGTHGSIVSANEMDRNRLLKEVAVLERSIRALKSLTQINVEEIGRAHV